MLDTDSQDSAAFPGSLLAGLDLSAFDQLRRTTEEWRDYKVKHADKVKYADLKRSLARAWKEAKRLGLDSSPPLDILDIGMGPSFFLYVCKRLGHRGVGLDQPGHFPMWQGLRQWLGVRCHIEHAIKSNEKLPADTGRFDLVTAFRAQFNYNPTDRRLWNVDEWTFFLDQVRDEILKPGGRFGLWLNDAEHKPGLKRTDDTFLNFMAKRGAIQQGKLLLFAPLR